MRVKSSLRSAVANNFSCKLIHKKWQNYASKAEQAVFTLPGVVYFFVIFLSIHQRENVQYNGQKIAQSVTVWKYLLS